MVDGEWWMVEVASWRMKDEVIGFLFISPFGRSNSIVGSTPATYDLILH
jgi:hypothetical protein